MTAMTIPPGESALARRAEFRSLHDGLAAIGGDQAGGWTRFAWTPQDRAAREWFTREAEASGMGVETDRNGNLWATWPGGDASGERQAGPSAVGTGSHLDTVRNGGAYDGALGVICGLLAVRRLQQRRLRPRLRVQVAAFADEEGGRFGLATFGSRLAAGVLQPEYARDFRDAEDVPLIEAVAPFGVDPGPDPDRLAQLAAYVEVHVEQGRGLVDLDAPVGVATGIWPHGRWRLRLTGEGNHAGTTRLADRRDPTLPLAVAIQAARRLATGEGGVATVGRITLEPNGTNSIPAAATGWLDARAADEGALARMVAEWTSEVRRAATEHGVDADVVSESLTPAVSFDRELADRLAGVLGAGGLPAPRLATAAGHDAGALAASVPTGMLFVRNPTGASHTPAEYASDEDCLTVVEVLADVLEELACR